MSGSKNEGVVGRIVFDVGQLVPAAEQVPTFRSGTDVVQLDVSVRDNTGRFVTDLAQSDFSVYEDGKLQDIAFFEAVVLPGVVKPNVVWANDVSPDVASNEQLVKRLWVLMLDDGLIPPDPFAVATSISLAKDVVSNLGPQDQAAIVYTTDNRRSQDFTNDHKKLLAALDEFHPGWSNGHPPPTYVRVNPDVQFWDGTANTFKNVMDTLAALPEYRKAITWISGGIPMENEGIETLQGLEQFFEQARAANVPVYAIHPCGITTTVGNDKCTVSADNVLAMSYIAVRTNGRPIVRSNAYAGAISRIFEERQAYYLIGYRLRTVKSDGKFHRLEVKTKRKGLVVSTRSGYFDSKFGAFMPATPIERVRQAIAGSVSNPELFLRATAVALGSPDKPGYAVVNVAVSRRPSASVETVSDRAIRTALTIGAFTNNGDRKASDSSEVEIALPPNRGQNSDYEIRSRLELPSGRVRLRIGAVDEGTGTTGTVMVDLLVPDFSGESLSASGVIVSADPALPFTGRIDALSEIFPTTKRDFVADDLASALLTIYQGVNKTPLQTAVHIRIVSSQGAVVQDETVTIPAEAFRRVKAWSSSEIRRELPLRDLPADTYLLTFTITSGNETIKRDVTFTRH